MDDFGDRMKAYERRETGRRFMPLVPVYARLDGRSFSSFTRGLDRPYDKRFSDLMRITTAHLVEETNAVMGYTQSDEISLAWYSDKVGSQIFFDGKIFKMTSVLSSMASVKFNKELPEFLPEKVDQLPVFDCRVYAIPTLVEAANAFLWREKDATKNAISMAARTMFSHNELHGKTGKEMQEMMWQKHGVNFNDYPAFFKRGVFIQRRKENRMLTEEELMRIPEDHRPTGPVERTVIARLDMPSFSKVENRVDVIFGGNAPITK